MISALIGLLVLSSVLAGAAENPARINFHSGNRVAAEGEEVTLSVTAYGTPPLHYQWFHEGEPLKSQDGPELPLGLADQSYSGRYQVEISNAYGDETSEPIWLTVLEKDATAGTFDYSFQPVIENGNIWNIAVDAKDRILIGGDFSIPDDPPRRNLARLLPDGTLDPSFDAGPDFSIIPGNLILLDDGKILLSGHKDDRSEGYLFRLQEDGQIDPTFQHGHRADGQIATIDVNAEGHLLVGGWFQNFDEHATAIVHLAPDGTVENAFADTLFNRPGWRSAFQEVLWWPDGRILASWNEDVEEIFGDWRPHRRFLRVYPDGTVDETFQHDLYLRFGPGNLQLWQGSGQDDPRILLRMAHQHDLRRLLADGSPDPNFHHTLPGGNVSYTQDGGRIYVTLFGGHQGRMVLRLHEDGQIDPTFHFRKGSEHWRRSVAVQSTGHVLLAGQDHAGPPLVRLLGNDGIRHLSQWSSEHELPADLDPADDPGGHGIPLLLRYAFALDPAKPNPALLPQVRIEPDAKAPEKNIVALTFRHLPYAEDIEYLVESSVDLERWEAVPVFEVLNQVEVEPGVSKVTIQLGHLSEEIPYRFWRVRVRPLEGVLPSAE